MEPTISRRGLLAVAGAAALGMGTEMAEARIHGARRPKALKKGDRIALIAPAGAVSSPDNVSEAQEKVRSLGFEPVLGANIHSRSGYLAGTDQQRAEDMNTALRDPSIAGILYQRGGYGAMRILPHIDYDAMRRHPKVTMGVSDVTALHLAFLAKSGVITFHGPCGESSWSEFSRQSMPICTDDKAYGEILTPPDWPARVTLVPGHAEGTLVAGNLSLVASMIGTLYCPKLKGCILALEDIGEDPYRVDRMLTEILLSPRAEGLKGLVFGNFKQRLRPGEVPEVIEPDKTFSIDQVLEDRAKAFGVPCFANLSFGHIKENHILPVGGWVRLDATEKSLKILEPAVNLK